MSKENDSGTFRSPLDPSEYLRKKKIRVDPKYTESVDVVRETVPNISENKSKSLSQKSLDKSGDELEMNDMSFTKFTESKQGFNSVSRFDHSDLLEDEGQGNDLNETKKDVVSIGTDKSNEIIEKKDSGISDVLNNIEEREVNNDSTDDHNERVKEDDVIIEEEEGEEEEEEDDEKHSISLREYDENNEYGEETETDQEPIDFRNLEESHDSTIHLYDLKLPESQTVFVTNLNHLEDPDISTDSDAHFSADESKTIQI